MPAPITLYTYAALHPSSLAHSMEPQLLYELWRFTSRPIVLGETPKSWATSR